MSEHLIDAKGLNTFYGASHILRDVNFGVARGETIGLMGRNGMGKSTLIKSVMGLVKPRSGSVAIMGKPMTGRSRPDHLPASCTSSFSVKVCGPVHSKVGPMLLGSSRQRTIAAATSSTQTGWNCACAPASGSTGNTA